MGRYYFGTAGWSYEDWNGVVYPEKKGSNFHPLRFLLSYINIVEINSTFYRQPSLRVSLSWVKIVESSPDFLIAVKLHQVFSHNRKDFSQKDVGEFKMGIEPLRVKNRLGAVLIQFPWSFYNSGPNNNYLIHLFKLFSDLPLAVELRHSSWDTPQFYSLLKEHQVCYCNIDQPIFQNSIKPSAVVTNPEFSYVRLHGRNYKDWFRKDAGRDERYNYLYSKQELEEWVNKIKELAKKGNKVFVITNNHYRGQALANALQIKNMVTGEKVEVPPLLLSRYPLLKEIIDRIKKGQLDLFQDDESN